MWSFSEEEIILYTKASLFTIHSQKLNHYSSSRANNIGALNFVYASCQLNMFLEKNTRGYRQFKSRQVLYATDKCVLQFEKSFHVLSSNC